MANNICATYEDAAQNLKLVITKQSESEGRFWGKVIRNGVESQISGHGGFRFYNNDIGYGEGTTLFEFTNGNDKWNLQSDHVNSKPDFSVLYGTCTYIDSDGGQTPIRTTLKKI
ncbi:hypothetical protein [Pseudomonas sp. PB106]|uniref:hypothetical protein n=1 Tax=Pseudomonas sp. PB106 TaxID=2494699 RepID=UPI00131D1E33|nr:hypothetical protein [Pseudomonas sp. PB106]KAE9645179.1 hypothetical protein EJA71_11975 [Pseudomonas sp. PB106]